MMRHINLFFAAALSAVPVLGTGTESMRVPLRFESLDNAVADGNLIRLRRDYAQEGTKPLVFEAEEATIVELQTPDNRIMPDTQASGGHYVDYVRKMEYAFTVETPGTYQARFRAWFPLKAYYCHNECMDDGASLQVSDSVFAEPHTWFWTKGETYSLDKGRHVYAFPSPTAFCGGARLDKVALFPAGKDEVTGLGPDASPITTSDVGVAVTRRISLRRVQSWMLAYETIPNGGSVTVDYSFDKAKWFSAMSAATVTPPEPKPRFLYFRFSLRGKPCGLSPWMRGVELNVQVERDNPAQR